MTELYFTPTETSRLTGIDKKGLYLKRDKGLIEIVDGVRRGRKNSFIEKLISFDDIAKLRPVGYIGWITDLFRLQLGQTLKGESLFAFRVVETCRLTGLSHQWIQKQIKAGKITTITARRNYRTADEKLIYWSQLWNLNYIPYHELSEKILELFKLSWRHDGDQSYHSCRVGIGEFRAGRENGKFVCPNCLAQR